MDVAKVFDSYLRLKCVGEADDLSLFRGLSGDLFAISDIYKIFPERALLDKLEQCLHKLEDNIDRCKQYNFGYGLSGILYTLALLTHNGFINTSKDLYNKYDSTIMSCVSRCAKEKNYDMLFGLIGYGLYYLELSILDESKRQNIWNIIEKIISLLIIDGQWCYWEFALKKTEFYNKNGRVALLSFLHGFPSIIAFLYLCKNNGFYDAKIDMCIKLGLNTIRNCVHNYQYNSFPEFLINTDGKYNIKNYSPVPTYYCRGDFGLLNLFHEIDGGTYNKSFKNMIIKSFSSLPDCNESMPCFCHGVAGSVYFLKKFDYKDTAIDALTSKYIKNLSGYLRAESSNIKQGILIGYIGMIMPLLLQKGSNTNFEHLLLLSLNNRV